MELAEKQALAHAKLVEVQALVGGDIHVGQQPRIRGWSYLHIGDDYRVKFQTKNGKKYVARRTDRRWPNAYLKTAQEVADWFHGQRNAA